MSELNLSIVTIKRGVPSVLFNPIAGLGTVDEWREGARDISAINGEGTVCWLMDEDGELPWYRYDSGIETSLLREDGYPLALLMNGYGEDAHEEEPEEPPIYGCPVLGHDCSEERCKTKCRMCAFSWAEMAADRERHYLTE